MTSNKTEFNNLTFGGATSARAARRISVWLIFMCVLVAAMLVVGGATRLTDSGLSITEWKPVTGAIPPLSEAIWLEEFEKYKAIPEYREVNFGMSLEEFKTIYWWEWGHRFLGRLIGLAFFLPMVFFMATKQTTKTLNIKLWGLFILGALQGAMGWYMVKSGLTERIDVSQYRLAAHLSLAVILFAGLLWLVFDLKSPNTRKPSQPSFQRKDRALYHGALFLSLGVFAQMILGAFVAGLRAGRTFNTWPLMDGKFFPDGYFAGSPDFSDLFETIAAVQFNHRVGAYIIAAASLWFFISARGTAIAARAKLVLGAVGFQFVLGIWTLLAATPISLGLLHQLGALMVLGTVLYAAHGAQDAQSR